MDDDYINEKSQEYIELLNGEEGIKECLKEKNSFENGFKKYCLVDRKWVQKYKYYLNNLYKWKNNKKI